MAVGRVFETHPFQDNRFSRPLPALLALPTKVAVSIRIARNPFRNLSLSKRRWALAHITHQMEVGVGFEPTALCNAPRFKLGAIILSANLPKNRIGSVMKKELKWFSWRESNSHLGFRKSLHCPLCYKKVVSGLDWPATVFRDGRVYTLLVQTTCKAYGPQRSKLSPMTCKLVSRATGTACQNCSLLRSMVSQPDTKW